MNTLKFVVCVAVLLIGTTALTGCSRSPRATFYTLGGAAKATTVNQSKSTASVLLANLTLPDLVDRPQLVERVTGNRVEILESHRWAEPLKSAIVRVLAENLASSLGSDLVTTYLQNSAADQEYRISVDIQRFESMGDAVSIDATWTIRRKLIGSSDPDKRDSAVRTKTGRSQVRESRGGDGYEVLVAAYNRAIAAIGNDIAGAIRTEWAATP